MFPFISRLLIIERECRYVMGKKNNCNTFTADFSLLWKHRPKVRQGLTRGICARLIYFVPKQITQLNMLLLSNSYLYFVLRYGIIHLTCMQTFLQNFCKFFNFCKIKGEPWIWDKFTAFQDFGTEFLILGWSWKFCNSRTLCCLFFNKFHYCLLLWNT